ncbi:oligosaccharide flippase family protein [Brevundimonas sp. TWP2-3-2]|uniref:oligosaccharide flippase family protein n=1 Tax=unclassified Brevundimonas TaxID=2622653 RepID=UPI003CF195C9
MGDRLYMTASVLIRMGAGLLVFVLMARGLGPSAYGLVATVFAYATLASLLTDFGFASKTLRDIGADPDGGGAILNASLGVKAYLTVAVGVGGAAILFFVPGEPVNRLASGLLGAAVLIGTIGDLALTAYRAVGRYSDETWMTIWTSGVHLVLIGWISLGHGDLLLLAIGFVASRLLYTGVAVIGAERLFTDHSLRFVSPREVWTSLRGAWSWAADSGLGFLTGQIDGFLVPAIFGLQAAGIYQAGGRFIQAALGLVTILAAVHIPRLAKVAAETAGVTSGERRMMIEFTAAGAVLGLMFWLGGPLITTFLLGPEYGAVNALWLGFSVFLVIRYMAASLGAALSARGLPLVRVAGQVAALLVVVVGLTLGSPRFGLVSVPWIMSAGALATLISFCLARLLVARGRLGTAARDCGPVLGN